jgi:peptide/nickel transport system substrate-binding protein
MTKNLFKHRIWWAVTIIMILSMVLTACAQPTPAPEEPEEPAVEEPAPEPEVEEPAPEPEVEEPEPEPEVEEKTTLVYAAEGDIRSLDPMYINNRLDMSIIMHIFDMLGYRDRDGVTQPQAAESWEQIDPNTWEFKLREGVMFSNGEEMTSEDVAYSMERAQLPEFNNFYQLPAQTGLKEVKIIDDYTFQFITEEPSLTMEFWLAEAPIVPKGYYSEGSADEKRTKITGVVLLPSRR